jgi:hypothetical protein
VHEQHLLTVALLERLIRASFEVLKTNEQFWRLSYGVRMQAAVLEKLGGRLQAWLGEIQSTLETYLREARVPQPEVEARILFALIDGIAQHYVLDSAGYPLEAVVGRVIRRYQGRRAFATIPAGPAGHGGATILLKLPREDSNL